MIAGMMFCVWLGKVIGEFIHREKGPGVGILAGLLLFFVVLELISDDKPYRGGDVDPSWNYRPDRR